jgi:hypothetical protein
MARAIGWLVVLALLVGGFFFGRDYVRRHPQDFPWTRLDLADPTGAFTASKIAGLGDEPARCQMLLAKAGVTDEAVAPRHSPPDCGFADGVRLTGRAIAYRPGGVVASCPVAAALHLFETRVVQPAAERQFGQPVRRIFHAGSYSCRRLYGRAEGRFSEHSTADAIDITGFDLADGQRISVLEDWNGGGPEAAFLREVRDGACDHFSTVLSLDYNPAHRDHLHFDVANRGAMMWNLCR